MPSRFLDRIPDEPRWVETRAMLLAGNARLLGVREDSDGCHFVALRSGLASIVGHPHPDALALALKEAEEVLSPTGYSLDSPEWEAQPAVLHELRNRIRAAPVSGAGVQFIEPSTLSPGLPAQLRDEILDAAAHSPVAATYLHGQPVSFCYGVPTETLWDVSIDTLELFRGRGCAGLCVDLMIDAMAVQGKRPVWGALVSNSASLRLAAKLGFVPVDEIIVYSRVTSPAPF